jgi:hypothetical protein
MKIFLGMLMVVGLVCFMCFLAEDAAKESPKTAVPVQPRTVNAAVRFDAANVGIKNSDSTNWPTLEVFINGSPPFSYRYVMAPLAPGQSIVIPLNEFAKEKSGERFDPFRYKLTSIWIGGNGFDYQERLP